MHSWLKNRYGYGELLGMVLAYGLLVSKGSAGSCGRGGLRAGVLPAPLPQGWNPVNKNLFPSTQIVGSCVKVPCGRALVCSDNYHLVQNIYYLSWIPSSLLIDIPASPLDPDTLRCTQRPECITYVTALT